MRFRTESAETMRRIDAAFAGQAGWRDQMRAAAYEMLRFLLEDRERARRLFLIDHLADDRLLEVREEVLRKVTAMIDRGREELEDPDSLPPVTAELATGAIYSRIQIAIQADDFEDGPKIVQELMCSVVLLYRGRDAALEELRIPPPSL